MLNDETQFLVDEIKGLLQGLERDAKDIRYDLASDNVYKICDKLDFMRKKIDHIKSKVNKQKSDEIGDDEFI